MLTDEKWFCFVLEEVLTNAVKYTRQGTISVIWEDGRLYVRDTGLGIRPEDVDAAPAGATHDLDAKIEIAELMGAEINLHLDYKGTRVVLCLCQRGRNTFRIPALFGTAPAAAPERGSTPSSRR
mgnify:CR=1 FL=1